MDTRFGIKLQIPIINFDSNHYLIVECGPYCGKQEAYTILMDSIDFVLKMNHVSPSMLVPDDIIIATIYEYGYDGYTLEEFPSTITEYIQTNQFK